MFPRGYQKSHAKGAKPRRWCGAQTRNAKEDWLLVTGNWGGHEVGKDELVYVLFRLEKN